MISDTAQVIAGVVVGLTLIALAFINLGYSGLCRPCYDNDEVKTEIHFIFKPKLWACKTCSENH